ncbi:uncharacterized protein BO97DRAFT_184510 [Aspergillus homomorphus CBS 101889]|uniref:N-acetyltransferase domain-containing protein n=1 Tax=Aspergillus homomorphus (strain CBS 101889) TaxID=1450537 RepID=A0A395IDE0_ASPHC|nr:hypothetical protein BO97DRAFT_184510 [Aspergillus homomorphus CBS 101889]RAL16174.1 hypothetical protein BO97DRAFT_184510 [Aspergillus homomorphus CBS 101889]
MSSRTETKYWTREHFLVSTDKNLLSPTAINRAFAQDFIYWAQPFPEEVLRSIIDNSVCFGLYRLASHPVSDSEGVLSNIPVGSLTSGNVEQIGFGRLITDSVTFAYLSDVYVLPEYQGNGLGGWLIDCVDEVVKPLPYLRWLMLRTSGEKRQESYEKRLGMSVIQSGDIRKGPVMMGRKGERGTV